MQKKQDITLAIMARNVLFTAGAENITDTAKLEETLKGKGIKFRVFDVKPIFTLFRAQFQSERIE